MDELQKVLTEFAWAVNAGALVIVLCTRWLSHKKSSWAWIGVILLAVSMGNATILASYDQNGSAQLASLFATVVYGALGSTFVANWLVDGAT